MRQEGRQQQILEWLAQRGECSVEEFAQWLSVSDMTVRRDLDVLAKQGKVIRTHGGAAMAERVSFEFEFLNRVGENQAAKEAIAAAAAAQVRDGESVLLDSGTTTLALAKCLRGTRSLTIITTSLPIAAQLQFESRIEVLLLGGYLRPSTPDLAGAMTEANLDFLRADVAFLGAEGIDAEGTVYQDSPDLARTLNKMAASARRVFVVADSSKLGCTTACPMERLQQWEAALVTDDGADPVALAALKKAGARVILAACLPASGRRAARRSRKTAGKNGG